MEMPIPTAMKATPRIHHTTSIGSRVLAGSDAVGAEA
jgi:hypothetical protein